MKKNNKKLIFISAGILFIAGLFFGINRLNAKEPILLSVSSDFPITEDINEMKSEADVIVKGTYNEFVESWNMARDDYDLSKENEDTYVEGHIYNFEVTEVLSGKTVDSNIRINHHYARDYYIEEEDDSFLLVNNLYKKPEMNQEFILFLKYDVDFDLYYGAIEPFTIKVNDNQTVELFTPLTENLKDDKSKTFELKSGKAVIVEEHTEDSIEDFIKGENVDTLLEELSN